MNLIPRSMLDIDSVFDNFTPLMRSFGESPEGSFMPRVDVKEKKDKLEITAELPGVKKDDIEVTLENGILTLSAESHQEDKEEKDGKVLRQERRYGKYVRSFSVGNDVQEKDIKAHFEDGVLKLFAPRPQSSAPETKRISIN